MRCLIVITISLLLIGCSPQPDRCTADPNLPDCQAARAVAQSTIVAANANTDATVRQAQLQATKDAMALSAQATHSAVIISSTAVAVSAQATRTQMEMDAWRESLALTATLQAVRGHTEATRIALDAEARLRAGVVDMDTAGLRQWLLIGIGTGAFAVIVISLTRTTQRTTERVGNAIANRAENHAALVHYGHNQERLGLIERHADGTITFQPLDHALAALDTWLPKLNVPDREKLQAIADYSKRAAVIEGVGVSGQWPLIDEGDEPEPLPQLAVAQAQYPYTIVTQSALGQPIAGWLDEVELKLLASAVPTGGQA